MYNNTYDRYVWSYKCHPMPAQGCVSLKCIFPCFARFLTHLCEETLGPRPDAITFNVTRLHLPEWSGDRPSYPSWQEILCQGGVLFEATINACTLGGQWQRAFQPWLQLGFFIFAKLCMIDMLTHGRFYDSSRASLYVCWFGDVWLQYDSSINITQNSFKLTLSPINAVKM